MLEAVLVEDRLTKETVALLGPEEVTFDDVARRVALPERLERFGSADLVRRRRSR